MPIGIGFLKIKNNASALDALKCTKEAILNLKLESSESLSGRVYRTELTLIEPNNNSRFLKKTIISNVDHNQTEPNSA